MQLCRNMSVEFMFSYVWQVTILRHRWYDDCIIQNLLTNINSGCSFSAFLKESWNRAIYLWINWRRISDKYLFAKSQILSLAIHQPIIHLTLVDRLHAFFIDQSHAFFIDQSHGFIIDQSHGFFIDQSHAFFFDQYNSSLVFAPISTQYVYC